jgi:hypothetical protein
MVPAEGMKAVSPDWQPEKFCQSGVASLSIKDHKK